MYKSGALFAVYIFALLLFGCKERQEKQSNSLDKTSDKSEVVGGPCDGCEIMYVDMPNQINSIDTSAGWYEKGQRLIINGSVKKSDGVSPAKDVVIYYWHTDDRGYYSPSSDQNERSKRHGHLRGWVKSDVHGNYFIYTVKPGAYPNNSIPAHIHVLVKEGDVNKEYYIDDLVFNGDEYLTKEYAASVTNRGGSGILYPEMKDKILVANHNITLGLNIPAYPK